MKNQDSLRRKIEGIISGPHGEVPGNQIDQILDLFEEEYQERGSDKAITAGIAAGVVETNEYLMIGTLVRLWDDFERDLSYWHHKKLEDIEVRNFEGFMTWLKTRQQGGTDD